MKITIRRTRPFSADGKTLRVAYRMVATSSNGERHVMEARKRRVLAAIARRWNRSGKFTWALE